MSDPAPTYYQSAGQYQIVQACQIRERDPARSLPVSIRGLRGAANGSRRHAPSCAADDVSGQGSRKEAA